MTSVALKLRIKRATCALVGCVVENEPCCHRCWADLYGGDYIECGKLDPLFRAYWWVRRTLRKLRRRKCDHCGKKFVRGYCENLCSAECFDEWLPF